MRMRHQLVLAANMALVIPLSVRANVNPVAVPSSVQYAANGMPILNSNSNAAGAAFIDFDGGYWGYAPFNYDPYDRDGDPTTFNAQEAKDIYNAWLDVSTHFAMFDINVTTIQPNKSVTPTAHVLVSPSMDGGAANVNRYGYTSSNAYGANEESDARTRSTGITHELGHIMGLYHQSTYDANGNLTAQYRGADSNNMAPIMGVDYAGKFSHWALGPNSNGSTVIQSDMQFIANKIATKADEFTGNSYAGDGFRLDEYGNTREMATLLSASSTTPSGSDFSLTFNAGGIIERYTDTDMFAFNWAGSTGGRSVTFTAEAVKNVAGRPLYASSLGMILSVYNSAGTLLGQNTMSDVADVQANLTLTNLTAAGTYYVGIQSFGGYEDLGAYTLNFSGITSTTGTIFWDNNGSTTGFGTASGTWASPTTGNAAQGWSTSLDGSLLPANYTTLSTDIVSFGTNSDGVGAGTVTVSGTVSAGGIIFGSASGATTLNGGTINLSGVPYIAVSNATDTINSVLAGSSGLAKTGTGTLVLTGVNTYTGATDIAGGTLTLSGNGTLASSAAINVSASGATFNISGVSSGGRTVGSIAGVSGSSIVLGAKNLTTGGDNTSTNFAGVISGTGSLTKTGSGTLTLSGGNTYTGTTTVNAGNLTLAGTPASTSFTVNGGTLALSGSGAIADTGAVNLAASGATFDIAGISAGGETIGSITGVAGSSVTLGGKTLTVGADDSSGTFAGVASGTGGLTKSGSGTLTLTGNNTFTGAATVNAGTLALTGSGALADTAAVNTAVSGATFDISGISASGETVGSIAGASGSSILMGTKNLTAGGNNTSTTFAGVIGGSGSLTKTGTGSLTLSGSNVYTGDTVLNAGTLATTADANLGNGGAISVTGAATWNAGTNVLLTYNRDVNINNGATLTLASGNAVKTITGVLSGSGALVNSSNTGFTFNNTGNTFTGAVNNGYQMSFASIGDSSNPFNLVGSNSQFIWIGGAKTFALRPLTLNATGTGNFVNNGTGAVTIEQDLSVSGTAGARTLSLGGSYTGGVNTFSGDIDDGAGSVVRLTKAGASTWALTGSSNYTGATTLSASGGVLAVNELADGGVNSSIGAATNDASNLLLGNGTTLRYTGSGHSTDRGFTVNGTSAGHSATIEASGAGAIAFTNTASPAYGTTNQTRTLILTGTNTGDNTLAAGLANNGSGAVSLTKSGVGSWRLSGNNSYTGTTTVSGGALTITGSSASPTVTISGGSLLLSGAGDLSDTAAINTSASGAVFDISGISAGSETVGSITGTAGSSVALGGKNLIAGANNASTTYTGIISGNGGSLTKTGTGTLTLTGANTYTGQTSVTQGVLSVNANSVGAVINSSLSLSGGGRLTVSAANLPMSNAVTVGAGGGGLTVAKNNNATITGPLTGSEMLSFVAAGGSGTTPIYNLENTAGFTGALSLDGADVRVTALNDTAAGNIIFASANASTFSLSVNAASGLTLDDRAIELSNFGGTLNNNSTTRTLTVNSDLVASGANAKTLTLNGAVGPTNVFAGDIGDGAGGGTVALSKLGSGAWSLSGTNTYSGATTIAPGGATTNIFTIQGMQALSPNTTVVLQDLSSSRATLKLLDDATGTIDRTSVGVVFQTQQSSAAGTTTFFVGNNSTANGGTSAATTEGSTIALGGYTSMPLNNGASGDTINITGANGYQLQLASVAFPTTTLAAKGAGSTFTMKLVPTTASLVVAGGVGFSGTGNVGNGNATPVLNLDGTAAGNAIQGDIVNPSDAPGVSKALSVTKTNSSTWTLSGDNSFSGGLTLNGATAGSQLNINSPTALGTGAFTISGGNNARIDNTSGAAVMLVNNNAQTWSNDFTFVGTNDLNLGTGNVTLGGNRNITVSAGQLTVGGAVSGGFGITKAGAGTLLLGGASSYTGATTVNNGALLIDTNGSINTTSGLTINAGSVATAASAVNNTVRKVGPLDINGTGSVTLEASGQTGGSRNRNVLETQGAPTLEAASRIDLIDNGAIFRGASGDAATVRANIMTGRNGGGSGVGNWNGSAGITTSFTPSVGNRAVGYAVVGSGTNQLNISSFLGQSLTAGDVVVRTTRPGDANLDGFVNVLDRNIYSANIGTGKVWSTADWNYDGNTNVLDRNLYSANIGTLGDAVALRDAEIMFSEAQVTFAEADATFFETLAGSSVPGVTYDRVTGQVRVNPDGFELQTLFLELSDASLIQSVVADIDGAGGQAWSYDGFIGGMNWSLPFGTEFTGSGSFLLATLDPGLKASNFGLVAGSPSGQTAQAVVSVVPEPASLSLLALAASGLIRRRRRA